MIQSICEKHNEKIHIDVGGRGNVLLNQLIAADEVKRGLFAVDTDAREKLLPLFESGKNVYILTGLRGGTSLGLVPVLCECAKDSDAHTVLYAVIDGEMPTEKEKGVLSAWRALAGELRIWDNARIC